jgi:outer membrane lipoprotein-sorting protein
VNPDGTRSTGTLYIRRPGRARFEYDPPDNTLVMAGGGQLAIFDGKSNIRRPEQYPLRQTPLNVILERTVDLAQSGVVVGHSGTPTPRRSSRRTPRPEIGRIALVFAENPLRLTGWMTEDGSGAVTRVDIGDPADGHAIPAGSSASRTRSRAGSLGAAPPAGRELRVVDTARACTWSATRISQAFAL